VTLKKIERLRIISIIFICGFPGPNANNSQAPQFANVEEAPAQRHCPTKLTPSLHDSEFVGLTPDACNLDAAVVDEATTDIYTHGAASDT
jgi:hypothetical protein